MIANSLLFDRWAPESSVWSPWAKPTVFASRYHVDPVEATETVSDPPEHIERVASPQTAIIVDIHGPDAVSLGRALSTVGYQPVPLFNGTSGPGEVVPTGPILAALSREGDKLRRVPPNAPPAFLLDSRRMAVPKPKTPGQFDNRWMTFPQDFPSASFLREAGITNAIVIGMGDNFPQTDLIHILLRWQQGGIPIQKLSMAPGSHPAPMELRRPSWFGFAFQRLLATFGLRRSEGGGFGSVVPDPHQSGGRG